METISTGGLKALISLLSDRDGQIVRMAKAKLRDVGSPALELLRQAADRGTPGERVTARALLEEIRLALLGKRLHRLCEAGQRAKRELETAVFLLAQSEYPDLNVGHYTGLLDDMAADLRSRLARLQQPYEIIRQISTYLFRQQGFYGNLEDYYNPDNSYINQVLDRRTGIPITLSALYLFLARRLRLPMVGVGMPGHYIVKYEGQGQELLIDPFNGGVILSHQDCLKLTQRLGYEFSERLLRPASNRVTLKRMVRNLLLIYDHLNDETRKRRLDTLLASLHRSSDGPSDEKANRDEESVKE